MQDLSCRELVELVTAYFEDALSRPERARFEAHLDECPGCTAHLEQVRTTIRLARAGRDLERRPEMTGLLEAFRDWHRTLR
jgi:anti-sigma factor RsiW